MTDLASSAKRYSYKLISYRGRSENELREKLLGKGFPEGIISDTITYLKEAGYINDRALAENLKRQAISNRMLGYAGARRFMNKRGLSYEIIESALDYDEEMELQNATKLIYRKLNAGEVSISFKEKRKLWNFLARRGYSFNTIKKAFNNCNLEVKESLQ